MAYLLAVDPDRGAVDEWAEHCVTFAFIKQLIGAINADDVKCVEEHDATNDVADEEYDAVDVMEHDATDAINDAAGACEEELGDAASSKDFGADSFMEHQYTTRSPGLASVDDVAADAVVVTEELQLKHVASDHSYFTAANATTYYFNY